jgi:hypothetical protein
MYTKITNLEHVCTSLLLLADDTSTLLCFLVS